MSFIPIEYTFFDRFSHSLKKERREVFFQIVDVQNAHISPSMISGKFSFLFGRRGEYKKYIIPLGKYYIIDVKEKMVLYIYSNKRATYRVFKKKIGIIQNHLKISSPYENSIIFYQLFSYILWNDSRFKETFSRYEMEWFPMARGLKRIFPPVPYKSSFSLFSPINHFSFALWENGYEPYVYKCKIE